MDILTPNPFVHTSEPAWLEEMDGFENPVRLRNKEDLQQIAYLIQKMEKLSEQIKEVLTDSL